jgi:hypothetical protein
MGAAKEDNTEIHRGYTEIHRGFYGMAKKIKEASVSFRAPPKTVHNDRGEIVEVILSYEDYKIFLRVVADTMDWELLPGYLQDEVDHLLAEEARAEQGDEPLIPLHEALRDTGDLD